MPVLLFLTICFPALLFGQSIEPQEQDGQAAVIALSAYIDDTQKRIDALTQKETNARNRRNAARTEADGEKKESQAAEKEYKDALASLRENPQSQTARRTVDIAQQHLEEANANYGNKRQQAKTADDYLKAAESELRKEKAQLEELRELMMKLDLGAVSPQDVLARVPKRFVPVMQPPEKPPVQQADYEEKPIIPSEKNDERIPEETSQITLPAGVDTTINNCRNIDGKKICDTTFYIIFADDAAQEQKRGDSHRFVFSARPEFVAGLVKNSISAIGAAVEFGTINPNGYYFTGDLSGGALYYAGGGVNIGYCLNKDGVIKAAVGGTAGLYFTRLNAEFVKGEEKIASAKGKNISFAGIFIKLMGGGTKNFDITYKLLFGYGKAPLAYNEISGEVGYDEGFGARHSFGFGYTLTRAKK